MTFRTLLTKLMIGLCIALAAPAAALAQPTSAPPAMAADQNYIIGAGDTLQIDLRERSDFSTKAKVGTDGMIQLPYIGNVAAANRTTQQLSDEISTALIKGGFFEHPILAVEVSAYAARYVTVLGAVTSPGLIPIDRAYHVSEIIARVGGIREGGADYVILRPAKGAQRNLSVRALATGQPSDDPYVSPGDTIYCPVAELFYISGQVKAPGAYPMISDMTLRMAIGRGGGLTDMGSDHGIKITRHGEKVSKSDLDSKIEPGDVIVIGERLF